MCGRLREVPSGEVDSGFLWFVVRGVGGVAWR